ncbi:MAG: carbonic anhydrase [Alphaproteobacteria bacterium]
MVDPIDRLIAGFRGFRARYYEQRPERMQELAREGQSPEVMLIACSDSRVDPALLLGSEPGELFIVRNVANLVPPYGPDNGHHGTSAALEFAVRDLQVKHIVILGHSMCGGVKALRAAMSGEPPSREFIAPWMEIAAEACPCGADGEVPEQSKVERDGIRISLRNLLTFPWIADKVSSGELGLHGWWIDLDAVRCATPWRGTA